MEVKPPNTAAELQTGGYCSVIKVDSAWHMQGVGVVWMQAKKVENAEATTPMANVALDRTQQQHFSTKGNLGQKNSSQTISCYASLSDNGYLSLQFRLIMRVALQPMTSDGAVTQVVIVVSHII
jgi:hypothetical protein